jgi:hypothetical protein
MQKSKEEKEGHHEDGGESKYSVLAINTAMPLYRTDF